MKLSLRRPITGKTVNVHLSYNVLRNVEFNRPITVDAFDCWNEANMDATVCGSES